MHCILHIFVIIQLLFIISIISCLLFVIGLLRFLFPLAELCRLSHEQHLPKQFELCFGDWFLWIEHLREEFFLVDLFCFGFIFFCGLGSFVGSPHDECRSALSRAGEGGFSLEICEHLYSACHTHCRFPIFLTRLFNCFLLVRRGSLRKFLIVLENNLLAILSCVCFYVWLVPLLIFHPV